MSESTWITKYEDDEILLLESNLTGEIRILITVNYKKQEFLSISRKLLNAIIRAAKQGLK